MTSIPFPRFDNIEPRKRERDIERERERENERERAIGMEEKENKR